uniref:Fruit bromelain n=1 Tax=Aegilops tauschii TaxID=37682 RepID=M8BPA6_AEGTA
MAPIHSSHRLHGTLLLLVLVAATAFLSAAAGREEALAARHEQWMAKHGRLYTDAAEKLHRQEVFAANAWHVDAVNQAGNRTYTLGLNQFSDLTYEEFAEKHLGYSHQPVATVNMSKAQFRSTPDSVDWRGAVTQVKNQLSCACCWAFVAVAATEGLVKLAPGNLISMSEQQVLDGTGSRSTCKGGYINDALNYIPASGALQLEKDYAYSGQQGACRSSGVSPNSAASVGAPRFASLHGDEGALQELVASQPVAVAVEADYDFQHYFAGVYTGSSSCGQKLNHAVTVVGYGNVDGSEKMEYWMVKNQWGSGWGEGGYMRLTRGNGSNNCGMATYAYYPTYDLSSRGDSMAYVIAGGPLVGVVIAEMMFRTAKLFLSLDIHGPGQKVIAINGKLGKFFLGYAQHILH